MRSQNWIADFGGANPCSLSFDCVVNATSFDAIRLASAIEGYPVERLPKLFLCKGRYFSCGGRPAFERLIYPAPCDGLLGIHLTLDLAGRVRFGPDMEWVGEFDFHVDPQRSAIFYAAIRQYRPALPDGALTADYAGIRPRLTGPGATPADFRIDSPSAHGLDKLVNQFGIESPGLTASLSIAEQVADILTQQRPV